MALVFALWSVSVQLKAEDGTAFFEARIRPVLVRECYPCHSSQAKGLKGGLSLETRSGILKGGDSGPALVANKPSESLLLSALKYDGDVRMPPKGKLPDAVVRDFERWIESGAPDPRAPESGRPGSKIASGSSHWAYQPPNLFVPPRVAGECSDVIDAFVRKRLEDQKLAPASEADRATLLRRLYLDLVGLPPTREEIDEFLVDAHPATYERVVDRLLASPAFGERWGRHWLDVARFAESLTLRGFLLKESWRYRDYVIGAFNDDLPFDEFAREQIAGDLLSGGDWRTQQRRLTATAFLMLGDANLEEQDKKQLRMDVVDEQLDVVCKGFLAQTVTCARCHDHKFDPIPTRDYYALAGVFRNVKSMEHANVSKLTERLLPLDPSDERRFAAHAAQLAAAGTALADARKRFGSRSAAKGVVAIAALPGIVIDDEHAKRVGEWTHSTHSGSYIGRGYLHDGDTGKGVKTLTFQPDLPASGRYEVRLAYSAGSSRASNAPVTIFSADGEKTLSIDMKKAPSLDGRFVSLGEYRFEKDGQSFVIVSNEGTKGHVTADAVVFLSQEMKAKAAETPDNRELANREAEVQRLERMPEAQRPSIAAPTEEAATEETRVHVRGSVHTLGEPAPRGVLTAALRGPAPAFPKNESGRRELADWIVSSGNPLTARVICNRVWHWLFGAGLVRSPDNFGTTGDSPTHPDLLDRLVTDFVNDGWSIKRLVRRLVLSQTYRQSSRASPAVVAADPENHWWARANRKRLDAEVLRDSMLAAAGILDRRMKGPGYPVSLAADYGFKTASDRRSVYLPVFRNALPEALIIFDLADPGAPTGRRNVSTVSTQALYEMNHPLVVEIARRAAKRISVGTRSEGIVRVYRTLLGRIPSDNEIRLSDRFLASSRKAAGENWEALVHALLCSAEFRWCE